MNNKIVWFPFYLGDYLKDTQHLSVIEHGMYLKLMLFYYSTGKPIPHSRRYAIADAMALPTDMLGESNGCAMVDAILSEFFIKDGAEWRHKRIDEEIAKRVEFNEKQRERAEKRWGNKDTKADAKGMPRHNHGNANHNHNHNIGDKSPKTPKGAGKKESTFILPDWIDPKVWDAFKEMRVKIKKPMTDKAMELTVKALEKLMAGGDNPNEVLEQSIQRCWLGVFSTKEKNNGTTNRGRSQTDIITEQLANIQ